MLPQQFEFNETSHTCAFILIKDIAIGKLLRGIIIHQEYLCVELETFITNKYTHYYHEKHANMDIKGSI